jgi:cell shape-determining protein MreC
VSKKNLQILKRFFLILIVLTLFFLVNLEPIQSRLYKIGYQLYFIPSQFINKITEVNVCDKLHLELEITRLKRENHLLKKEIYFTNTIEHRYVSTKIFQIIQSKGEEAFILEAGKKEGIEVGDFVIKGKNLLGRIVQVDDFAIVAPLGSSSFKVPAIILPAEQNCLLGKNVGKDEDLELSISYLKGIESIKEGDLVVSAWQEGLPFGIEIGYLIKVEGKFRVKSQKILADKQLVQVLIKHDGDHN